MSVHEEIVIRIHRIIDGIDGDVSPAMVAYKVRRHYAEGPLNYAIEYLTVEQLKEMARKALAGRFDPKERASSAAFVTEDGDLFGHRMQDRYPLPRAKGEDPVYRPTDRLTHAELTWVSQQLDKMATGAALHALEVRAYRDAKFPPGPPPTPIRRPPSGPGGGDARPAA